MITSTRFTFQITKIHRSCFSNKSYLNIFTTINMSTKAVQLSVSPTECQHDETISITVDGLTPKQPITLSAIMKNEKGACFSSHSHYNANNLGAVDVATMASIGGRYSGIFPMGLLSSLIPAPGQRKFTRFFKRDVENPNKVLFQVQDGHLSISDVLNVEKNAVLSSCEHLRYYIAPGVQRIPVKHEVVKGMLYIPPGPGPFPAVVDLFGSAGGLLDVRAAQLASKGFVTLALPYFAYEDLPDDLEEFHISYFEAAVRYLLDNEKVMRPNVGVIGVSKGSDLALAMATFIPEVTAVVAINGCISSVTSKLTLHDRIIEGLKMDISKLKVIDEVIDCSEVMPDPLDYPDTIIPIEEANARFLFIVGGDDKNWNSKEYLQLAVDKLKAAGKSNFQVLYYPKAGHLIEPPYSPFCGVCFHAIAGAPLLFGGELEAHTHAQVHSWPATIRFLRQNISHYRSPKL